MANIQPHSLNSPKACGSVSKESIVRIVTDRLERTFGKSTVALLNIHLPQYAISFDDCSIVEEPERFAEAMFYTFGSAAEVLFDRINEELMLYAPIYPLDDMTASGSAGYVFLVYKIRNKHDF